MPFFIYPQNDSEGYYTHWARKIIIQSSTAEEANEIAQQNYGIYFHGVSKEIDCECYGDRWQPAHQDDIYEKVPWELIKNAPYLIRLPDGETIICTMIK